MTAVKMRCTGGHSSGLSQPGDFTYEQWVTDDASPIGASPTQLIFKNPAGRFNCCIIHITRGPAAHPNFHWDGNRDAPTISPSIGCEQRCGWHGHIIAGEIRTS